ncbi:hypothetical protein FALBO_5495 [Fusarium albosuccineum]|uniref:Ubiquitin-like protease family profile domain-containing protein n=1 Tax=Fusarium albosuccineum TaxID=1237068 RepID=A0A8H4PKD9_9HYPO|nr:hypothetical protein FALBO_5495 [Fusarium albosuccineum]
MLGQQLTGPALVAGLQMATRGLEDVVVVAARPVDVPCGGYRANPGDGQPGHHGLFRAGVNLPSIPETSLHASSRLGFPTNEALQRAWFGKRFVVIPFNHNAKGSAHWTIGIFDRHLAHMLLWDTQLVDIDRYEARLRHTLRMMQVILSYNSQPYNFAFSAIPVSRQLQDWECGLLCLEIVRQTLRGHVGLRYSQICEIMLVRRLRGLEEPFCTPELRLCDWLPEPWTWEEGRGIRCATGQDQGKLAAVDHGRDWSLGLSSLDDRGKAHHKADGHQIRSYPAVVAATASRCQCRPKHNPKRTRGWVVDGSRVRRVDEEADIRALGRAEAIAAAAAGECISLVSTPAPSPAATCLGREAPMTSARGGSDVSDIVSDISLNDTTTQAHAVNGNEMEDIQPTGPTQRVDVNSTGVVDQAIPICQLGATQQPLIDMQARMVTEQWPIDRDGGREMVVDLRRDLGLRPAADASTQFLGDGRGWVTVLPYGIYNLEDLKRIVDAAESG